MAPDAKFLRSFQAELAQLRELAREFAEDYPEVADLVSERQADASVERLLQGTALLMSNVQLRLGDALPDISHPIFELLWPQYLRPTPAASLIQFFPAGAPLRQTQVIQRDTPVASKKVGQKACVFRTTSPVHLHPLQIEQVELTRPATDDVQLRIHFRLLAGATLRTVSLTPFRLQLAGEAATQYLFHFWLSRHLTHISVLSAAGDVLLRLPSSAARGDVLGRDEDLILATHAPLPAFQLLRDYFSLPERLLALDIHGLERLQTLERTAEERFTLAFHLGHLAGPQPRVGATNVLVGCSAVVNLRQSERVALPAVSGQTEFPIRLAGGGQVLSVERAGAYCGANGAWVDFKPLLGATVRLRADQGDIYFQLRRSAEGRLEPEDHILICDHEGRPISPAAPQVLIWLTHTDGESVLELGVGDISVPTAGTPQSVAFRNLVPPKPAAAPVASGDRSWRLLAAFTQCSEDLFSRQGLIALIELAQPEPADLPERLIRTVSTRITEVPFQRMLIPVRVVDLTLNEEAFLNLGDLHLFALVLFRTLAERASDRARCLMTVHTYPSDVVFKFGEEEGTQR